MRLLRDTVTVLYDIAICKLRRFGQENWKQENIWRRDWHNEIGKFYFIQPHTHLWQISFSWLSR